MRRSFFARIHDLHADAEDGFTLVEAMMASGILLTALVGLAYTTIISLSYLATSRDHQSANGLANQTMEQVRALPFATLEGGLDNADLSTSINVGSPSYDSNIQTGGCGGSSPLYCYGGEPIPHGNIAGATQPTC